MMYSIGSEFYVRSPDGYSLLKAGRSWKNGLEHTDEQGRKWIFNEKTRRWGLHPDSKKQKSKGKGKQSKAKKPSTPKPKVTPRSKSQPIAQPPIEKPRQVKRSLNTEKQVDAVKAPPAQPVIGKPDPATSAPKAIATFKGKSYNPHAKPDLGIQEFRQYQSDQKQLANFSDPNELWNQGFLGGSKTDYKIKILNAISVGVPVPEAALTSGGIKLTKSQKQQLVKNHATAQEMRSRTEATEKAINYPLVPPEVAVKHKPRMTREEAESYTNGTFLGGLNFYHGNPVSVVNSIAHEGAKPEKNVNGIYGQGTYFAASEKIGREYARVALKANAGSIDVAIATSQMRVQNPFVTDSDQLATIGKNFAGDQDNGIDSLALTQYMKARGHDSIYIQDLGYFVALDGKQVVTHEVTAINKGDVASQELMQMPALLDYTEEAKRSPTGHKLSSIAKSDNKTYSVLAEDEIDNFFEDD